MLVDDVGNGTAGILRLDEDACYHLGPPVGRKVGGHHIPGRTEIDVFLTGSDVCKRRGIQVPVAHVLEAVGIGIDIHLVVADGELVRPALHRIGLIAIEHDVVGHVVEIDPVLVHRLQGQVRIPLCQELPFVKRAFHPVLLAAQARFIIRTDAGQPEQQHRHPEQDETAIPHQKAAQADQIRSDLAHS